ncbi:MAG: DUF1659 domain-containing protein [Lysinibacillus sp.]
MANNVFKRATLNIYFEMGFDDSGKPIIKRHTLQNVAQSATPAALQAAAQAIATLYNGTLDEVEVVSNATIV